MKVTAEDIKKIKEERRAKAAKAKKVVSSASAAVDVDEAEIPAVSLVETSKNFYKMAEEKKEKASLLLGEHTTCRLAGDRIKAEALLKEAESLLDEADDLTSRANTLKEKEEAAAEAKAEAEAKVEREKAAAEAKAEVKGKKPNFILDRGDDSPLELSDFVFSNGRILKRENGDIVLELKVIDIK